MDELELLARQAEAKEQAEAAEPLSRTGSEGTGSRTGSR